MRMRLRSVLAIFVVLAAVPLVAEARDIAVDTAPEIISAVNNAKPGDVITVAPGGYDLPGLRMTRGGDPKARIVLRAAKPGTVALRSAAVEFIKISAPDWVVENFDIGSTCTNDSDCEHAFHIVGRADRTVIRGNRIHDYNAHIKGNGENGHFPSDVLIENNWLFDTRPRVTDNPIAPVDVVGGSRWVVRGNLIADFAKRLDHAPMRTDDWSYGMFLKGNSERGLIAGNIVGCIIDAPPTPSIRGIALGGSGTGPGLCDKGGDCTTEHRQGTIWGNIVFNCPAEPGIYLFQAQDTLVASNAVAGTKGIAAVGIQTSARITDNRLDGAIEAIGGATITGKDNTILGAGEAQQRYALPLLGKMSAKPGSNLERAAKLIAAYRAYRETLTKR
jgi:nitrous oxidase accessory protein NosD